MEHVQAVEFSLDLNCSLKELKATSSRYSILAVRWLLQQDIRIQLT